MVGWRIGCKWMAVYSRRSRYHKMIATLQSTTVRQLTAALNGSVDFGKAHAFESGISGSSGYIHSSGLSVPWMSLMNLLIRWFAKISRLHTINSGHLWNIVKRRQSLVRIGLGLCLELLSNWVHLDVLDAVSGDIPLGIIPQENTTFGSVIETADLLRLPLVGREKFVVGEITIAINHCLVVRKGVKPEDIELILSHEQVGDLIVLICSGLSSEPLVGTGSMSELHSKEFPKSINSKDALDRRSCRGITSWLRWQMESSQKRGHLFQSGHRCPVWVTSFEWKHSGFERYGFSADVLPALITVKLVNFTRFYIMSIHLDISDVLPEYTPLNHALVRLSVSSHNQTSPGSLISEILRALDLPVKRIDRRPSLDPLPFHDVYLIEVQESCTEHDTLKKLPSWIYDVEEGLQRVRSAGGVASLLGVWWSPNVYPKRCFKW